MFEQRQGPDGTTAPAAVAADAADKSSSPELDALVAKIRDLRGELAGVAATVRTDTEGDVSDTARIDRIRALEELKNTACAAQARLAADFDASQRSAQAAAGMPASLQGRGVAGQIGLARRESPHRGARDLGLGKVLTAEMPHTLTAMSDGWLSEWRATLLTRETACLSAEHRAAVDAELVRDKADLLEKWGDAKLVAEVRRMAYRLDPQAVLARIRKAEKERCVTSRPAPDTMAYLTALLPAAQAVACYAVLKRAADTARAAGDPRTRGQVMADTLVDLLTGKTVAEGTPVEIGVVITDEALLANLANGCAGASANRAPGDPGNQPDGDQGSDDDEADTATVHPREEPGYLQGYGVVPAGWIRDLVAGLPEQTRAWIRRLYRHPQTGELVAMESRRRQFTHSVRKFTVIRDQTCRTPWCDAPIRHIDHPRSRAEGGGTSRVNSQGLCEACNYAKEAPGWSARAVSGPGHTVRTTTPTGHVYDSTAPPLPGSCEAGTARPQRPTGPPDDPLSHADLQALWDRLAEQYAEAAAA